MTRGFGLGSLALCFGLAHQGCAIFDALWGQEKASQKRVAAQRAPATLHGQDETEKPKGTARRLAARVYATHRYAAAVLDWQRQFDDVVRRANPTLHADFGIELEVTEYRTWADAGSEDSLQDLLRRLALEDAGSDVSWVIALATAVPGLAESPDQLGMAATPGKHIVIRAMSDPEEFDAIERGFVELSQGERQKLYVSRKRHKAAVVLLHELGHTLGVPHEPTKDALMNPRYSYRSSDFSAPAIEIAKLELTRRTGASRAVAAASSPPSAPSVTLPSVPDPALIALRDDERRLFYAAMAQKDAQNLNDAWRIGAPLWASHPRVYVVQKLRCDLATAIGGAWERIRKECDDFMKLPAPPAP